MAPSIHRATLRLLDTVRLDSDHGHWALSVLFPLNSYFTKIVNKISNLRVLIFVCNFCVTLSIFFSTFVMCLTV